MMGLAFTSPTIADASIPPVQLSATAIFILRGTNIPPSSVTKPHIDLLRMVRLDFRLGPDSLLALPTPGS